MRLRNDHAAMSRPLQMVSDFSLADIGHAAIWRTHYNGISLDGLGRCRAFGCSAR